MTQDIIIPKAQDYEAFLDLKVYKHWWEFVNSPFSDHSIFRGHSNYYQHSIREAEKLKREKEIEGHDYRMPEKINFNIWETKSSFHRQFINSNFWEVYHNYNSLRNNIHLYETQLKSYSNKINNSDLTILQILQLFQHYGIPTPLIDFTKNIDTALYFAFSDLSNIGINYESPISDDFGNRFITIIELKIDLLKKYSLIECIGDNYFKKSSDLKSDHLCYYKPENTLNNKNIELQEGIFIYLDSEKSIEDHIHDYLIYNKLSLSQKPIIWHIIPYSSLNSHKIDNKEEYHSVFAYLLYRKKLGCYLFSDIKGIERDMKNSNIRFDCIKDPHACECLTKLLESDILKKV